MAGVEGGLEEDGERGAGSGPPRPLPPPGYCLGKRAKTLFTIFHSPLMRSRVK